jgi:hypothetical protein
MIPTITSIGTTNNAIWVPEPAAIPIDNSIFPFLASTIALLCSAAFPTIPIIKRRQTILQNQIVSP